MSAVMDDDAALFYLISGGIEYPRVNEKPWRCHRVPLSYHSIVPRRISGLYLAHIERSVGVN